MVFRKEKFNNYVFGDDILVDEIPSTPDFSNGYVIDPTSIGLTSSDFEVQADSGTTYIEEDVTKTIRRYNRLILEPVPFIQP